ncbi:MAG TPA: response regulator, partial [Gammaproteobacteria bacterium]
MSNTSQLELAIAERETPLMLIVDDDVVIRGMLKKALQRQQYDVVEAPNGAEAIEIFRNYRPDLVLLDVLMPIMNGYDACEAMRKLDPERTVPVLMLTGLDDVSSVDRAFDAGATDFITKPINWSLFTQRVRYALQARNMDFALRKSQHRIRYALQVAKLGYWDWDLTNNRFDIPASVLNMLGIENGEELQLSDLLAFVPDEDKDKVERVFIDARDKGQAFALEHRVVTSEHNQHYVFQQCDVIRGDDGKPRHVLGTIQDISALKRAEDMILHQAYHDQLTDLPNQTLYKDRLFHALKVAEHSKKKVAVILLDIDRFQVINESLGHDAGDMLLVEFAGFLDRFIQESDTVSRISGNEFA